MSSDKIRVGIIGSGAMGSGIAQVAAAAGHNVILVDNNERALSKAKENLSLSLNRLVEKQKITAADAEGITQRVAYSKSLIDVGNCGIIIEAIIENPEIKKEVFNSLDDITLPDCIIASNTSSLSITSIAASCKDASKVIGIHFFNPAPVMPLVEIIPGLNTCTNTVDRSKKILDSWGKIVVIAKDTPGFIVNRVARPFYGEAIRIYEEQIAGFATIDWAMKEIGGFKMGPFELMDLIGNDINYTVTETVWQQMFYDPRYKPSLTQKRMTEAGRLGRKTGIGYYCYGENISGETVLKDRKLGEYIYNRILCMLINEAIDTLYYGIASKEDIDLAMTKGVNYPKGLLKWADETGHAKVLSTLEGLQQEYAEDRYRPSVLLKQMVKGNKQFY